MGFVSELSGGLSGRISSEAAHWRLGARRKLLDLHVMLTAHLEVHWANRYDVDVFLSFRDPSRMPPVGPKSVQVNGLLESIRPMWGKSGFRESGRHAMPPHVPTGNWGNE